MVEILASANSALSIECNGRKGGGPSLVDAENSVTTHCGLCVRYYVFTPVTHTDRTSRVVRENMTRLQQAATSSRCYTVISRAFVSLPLARICATADIATVVHPRISVDRVYVQCPVLAEATVRVPSLPGQPVERSRQMCSVQYCMEILRIKTYCVCDGQNNTILCKYDPRVKTNRSWRSE